MRGRPFDPQKYLDAKLIYAGGGFRVCIQLSHREPLGEVLSETPLNGDTPARLKQ
jgi:hypothetical protein